MKVECTNCSGTGRTTYTERGLYQTVCPQCGGTGEVNLPEPPRNQGATDRKILYSESTNFTEQDYRARKAKLWDSMPLEWQEKHRYSALAHTCIDSLARGGDPIRVIEHLIEANDNTSRMATELLLTHPNPRLT